MKRFLHCLFITLIVLLCVVHYNSSADAPLAAHFIDVGQGDSCLLQLPNGYDVLIDGGQHQAGPTVVAYLQQRGVDDIEVLVATHGDSDHIGGLLDVLATIPVAQCWLDCESCTTQLCGQFYGALAQHAVVVNQVRAGEQVTWGDVRVQVLNPREPLYADRNENSVVLRVSLGSIDLLLEGDAESGAEGRMLASGLPLDAEVLKVAHHGSNSSSTSGFIAAVRPEAAIISVGSNSYGHPSATVLQRLQASGAQIYRTDVDGTVVITSDGARWWVGDRPAEQYTAYLPVVRRLVYP